MTNHNDIANAVRFLSVDMVQKANSGHPGMPLGMADIATVLWREFLNHSPKNSTWYNRDRFILSNGHGSALLYSLLHLTGYDLSIDDLKNFRQLHSKTPGHPELGCTAGVETTTGPLGQGLANAVGMALAAKILAAKFNQPGFNIIDHYTYVFIGDGCLMEGISHEVASFAGTQGLGKLIVFWDNNGISIDGATQGWFTENVAERFQAYNWQTISDVDGHNPDAIRRAIKKAQASQDKPTIICCKTTIGLGAPHLSNSSQCHGAPLGEQEIAAMRTNLKWPYEPFIIPDEIYNAWDAKVKGQELENSWQRLFDEYQKQHPDLAQEFLRRINHELPAIWSKKYSDYINSVVTARQNLATRQSSQKTLEVCCKILPELMGGSADLTASNLTDCSDSIAVTKDNPQGNYIHYGVREFGMFAIMNGLSLYGGFIPYGGTFLVFTSYGHSAIRMAAMMKQRVIYVLTHDSIGLGEDGPTHQPVEHLAMLRATPNLSVWRPSDAVETAVAWQYAIENNSGPTALILSRQKLPAQNYNPNFLAACCEDKAMGDYQGGEAQLFPSGEVKNLIPTSLSNLKKGGYILMDGTAEPDAIIIATGSEVELACNIAKRLSELNKRVRVVSMPSQDVFDSQDVAYKNSVLPPHITKRVAIEAASSQSWYKYVGTNGKVLSLDHYGESAPAKILFEFLGFSEQNGVQLILGQLNQKERLQAT